MGTNGGPLVTVFLLYSLVIRMTSHHCNERLHEAESGGDDAEESVRVLLDWNLSPALKLREKRDIVRMTLNYDTLAWCGKGPSTRVQFGVRF
jgi:hypothetical protein